MCPELQRTASLKAATSFKTGLEVSWTNSLFNICGVQFWTQTCSRLVFLVQCCASLRPIAQVRIKSENFTFDMVWGSSGPTEEATWRSWGSLGQPGSPDMLWNTNTKHIFTKTHDFVILDQSHLFWGNVGGIVLGGKMEAKTSPKSD